VLLNGFQVWAAAAAAAAGTAEAPRITATSCAVQLNDLISAVTQRVALQLQVQQLLAPSGQHACIVRLLPSQTLPQCSSWTTVTKTPRQLIHSCNMNGNYHCLDIMQHVLH
jgi:hypothetical protein